MPQYLNAHGIAFRELAVKHHLSDEAINDFAYFMSRAQFDSAQVPPNAYYLKKLDDYCITTTVFILSVCA